MTPFAHTGSTFEKLFIREICRIKSSTHWHKLRINIANSSGEMKLWKCQWRHSRIPEVFSKKLLQPVKCRIKSSFHWQKLRINTVNSSGENFNEIIRAYRKYFRKVVAAWYKQYLLLYSLAQTSHKYCLQQLRN